MAAPTLTTEWTKEMPASYEAGKAVYNAPVAVNAKGNCALTGAFTEDLTLGGTTLSAIGTSAYLAFADASGDIKWAVAFTGSASISDVLIADDDCIYIAATYTDEVELGAATGEGKTISGLEIEGAPTVQQNASFIAKYTAEGALAGVQTYIPEALPELLDTGMYYMNDGDVFFHINHLALDGNKLYASAIYTGATKIGDTEFRGSYNDPWFGLFFMDLKAAGIFSLDLNLENATAVATLGFEAPLATEDAQYQATSISLAAAEGTVYMAATCNGPMLLNTPEGEDITASISAPSYSYIFASIAEGKAGKYGFASCPESGQQELFVTSDIEIDGDNITILGYEAFAENYGEANERLGKELFAYTGKTSDLSALTKTTYEAAKGDLSYYGLTQCASLADGSLALGTLAYYNNSADGHSSGDFAGAGQTYLFADGAFTAFETVADANGISAAGAHVLFSTIGETSATFSLYKDENAGVANIAADSSNAPAEYYNLQGIRVENPSSGLYIRRQGKTAEKVLVK